MKRHTSNSADARVAPIRDQEAQREVQSFLQALRTYPDRFAQQPKLTFEQHLFRVAARQPPALRPAAAQD